MRALLRDLFARHCTAHRARSMSCLAGALGAVALASVLAACAPTAAAPLTRHSAPTATLAPTPTATVAPTSTATQAPAPTATPRPPAVAQSQPSAPPVLDLRPASMSIVGHLDCSSNGAYICSAEVISRASNQTGLRWSAFTNVPGHITFSPSGGTLAAGNTILVTITVPFTACTRGLFFFRGPANTHTIDWAC
ncbi:MAG TPA: hypothetical protein VIC27_13970 [Ktedonobacterales bacterium]|jgi:hypothetical protein